MTNSSNQTTAAEAQSVLKSLEGIERIVFLLSRPPLWLNVIISLLVGVATISTAFSSNSSLWTFVAILSAIAVVLTGLFWGFRLRMWGMTPKSIPPTLAGKISSVGVGIVIALAMLGAKEFYADGIAWSPYIAGAINSIACSFLLHSYLPNEWIANENST